MTECITIPYAFRKLCLQLDPELNQRNSYDRRNSIIEMLTAGALLPEAYPLVLDAFDYYKNTKKEPKRFSLLVNPLKLTESPVTFKTSALALINTLVNSPEEVTSRINMRDEFIELELISILPVIVSFLKKTEIIQIER